MKNYLNAFFDGFGYSAEDSAFLLSTYEKIERHPEAIKLWHSAERLYKADIHCDYDRIISLAGKAAILTGIHEYTADLLIFICISKYLQDNYRHKGIDDDIFYNSMLDLKYKLDECKAVKGVCGSFVVRWFTGFFDLTRFALGRLQFEIVDFNENYQNLTPDSRVINVHIPRTLTPLDKKSCDEAYAQAVDFFESELGNEPAFVCDSWLLYPENREILDKNSNVYRFMSEYEIVKWGINEDGRDLWRLFDTDETDPYKLPADTSMRRRYTEHLKKGGKTGWGYGVKRMDKPIDKSDIIL